MIRSPRSLLTVDLAAIRANIRFLRAQLGAGTGFLAALKADGYGHGLVQVALAAHQAGADGAAVTTAQEALALRDAGFRGRILVMGPLYGPDYLLELANQDIDVAVIGGPSVEMLATLRGTGVGVKVHLKVDTGMNRQGLLPIEVPRFLEYIDGIDEVHLVGVMTHFASAAEEPASVDEQLRRFLPVLDRVRAGWPQAVAHAANSAATMGFPHTRLDMVRCGAAIYGMSPFQGDAISEGLRPALQWRSQVVLVRRVMAGEGVGYGLTYRPETDCEIALVPLGYGDGFLRALGGRGRVLIRGRRYPIVGRVSMDSFTVNVGSDGRIQAGDTVTLIGCDGSERITVEEMARWAGTVNYEITCNTSLDRAERVFVEA